MSTKSGDTPENVISTELCLGDQSYQAALALYGPPGKHTAIKMTVSSDETGQQWERMFTEKAVETVCFLFWSVPPAHNTLTTFCSLFLGHKPDCTR